MPFSTLVRSTCVPTLLLVATAILLHTSLVGAFTFPATFVSSTLRVSNSGAMNSNRASELSLAATSVSTQSTDDIDQEANSIGFIGCGTIAAAIATGLATQTAVSVASIATSRRSESKSSALAQQFPHLVTVYDNNQDILDCSDTIFVCVLPQQTSQILKQLTFDPARHTVVSLVSTSTLSGLADDTSMPSDRIYKCICLPAVATLEGVCLITPKSSHNPILPLLDALGGVVQAESEEQMSAMMVPSGLMGSMYGMLKQSRDWLTTNGGVSKADASFLVGRLFYGMIVDAERKCREEDACEELIEEQTPGGLNEQALRNWRSLGALDDLDAVQDALFERITGRSDGSLDKKEG